MTEPVEKAGERVARPPDRAAVEAKPVTNVAGKQRDERLGGIARRKELGRDVREVTRIDAVGARKEGTTWRPRLLHVHGHHLREVEVTEAAVEEPQQELELVRPDEDGGVVERLA